MMDNKIQPSQIYTKANVNDQENGDFITDDEAEHSRDWGKKITLTKCIHISEIVQQTIEDLLNMYKYEPCRYVS
jgi:hypothetical protein